MRRPISCPSWVYILLVLTIISCSKNDLQPSVDSPKKESTNLVSIHLSGRVLDESSDPVKGAIVRSGNQVIQTDINGQFNFTSLMVNPTAALVEINKEGFYNSYNAISVLPESDQFAEFSLKAKFEDHQFNSGSGTAYESGNAQLNFPTDAITDKISGQNYSGIVHVAAYAMNRKDKPFFNFLPSIKGQDPEKKAVVLHPFSFVNTELTGASGQALEVSPGKMVTIRFPIAAGDLSKAPETISMWHYDLSQGVFSEEGKAVKTGSYYVGNVSHFSLWACATATPEIAMQANVIGISGKSLPYARLQLFDTENQEAISINYRADGNGYANLQAPANEKILIKVLNDCGDVLASKQLNTGSSKLWLGKIQAETEGAQTTISGKFENCKNSAVYSGHITLDLEGRIYKASISEGQFSFQVSSCSTTMATGKLVATDDAGNQESGIISFTLQPGNTDLGTITTCNPGNNQFVSYTLNGTNYLLQAPTDSLVQVTTAGTNKTTINCYSSSDKSKVEFSFSFTGEGKPGQYPVTALNINQDKLAFTPSGNIAVEVTNYGMPGEFITGKCRGQVKSPSFNNQAMPFSFNFKILRQF